ncbi:Endoplasmic reticulum membrane-associated RNA degradation protein [Sergentomyia squamirostris]
MAVVKESFISSDILDILLDFNLNKKSCEDKRFINSDLTLNWCKIEELCDPIDDFSYQNCKTVIKYYRRVWKVALWVVSCDNAQNFPEELYSWTHRKDCIEKVLKGGFHESASVEITLILSSIIEYSLGNVFFTVSQKTPPHLLRDVLATKELEEIFGRIPIFFLQILMGTPNGINLRNIVWHGFPTPEECPLYYPCILLLVILSFGKILAEKSLEITPRKLPYNPVQMINENIHMNTSMISLDFLKSSEFISPRHFFFWEEIFRNFSEENYASGIILFLPQFELILRRIYGHINGVDIDAKIGSYYVILDTFMEEKLPEMDKVNEIHKLLNSGCLHLIYDIFIAPKGPKIRDKISHGELSLEEFNDKHLLEKLITLVFEILSSISGFNQCREYRSQFHPNGQLLRDLMTTRRALNEIQNLPEIDFNLKDLEIFFRPPDEVEIVGILQKLTRNTVQCSHNYSTSIRERLEMLESKILRSRRRETLQKCLELMPKIQSFLQNLLQLIWKVFTFLQTFSRDLPESLEVDKLKKFLRKIQKYSENLTHSTQVSSNDWIRGSAAVDAGMEIFTKVTHLMEQTKSGIC